MSAPSSSRQIMCGADYSRRRPTVAVDPKIFLVQDLLNCSAANSERNVLSLRKFPWCAAGNRFAPLRPRFPGMRAGSSLAFSLSNGRTRRHALAIADPPLPSHFDFKDVCLAAPSSTMVTSQNCRASRFVRSQAVLAEKDIVVKLFDSICSAVPGSVRGFLVAS